MLLLVKSTWPVIDMKEAINTFRWMWQGGKHRTHVQTLQMVPSVQAGHSELIGPWVAVQATYANRTMWTMRKPPMALSRSSCRHLMYQASLLGGEEARGTYSASLS